MAVSKKRASKASSSVPARQPAAAVPPLPPLSVPDFDPAAFAQMSTDSETVIKDNVLALGKLQPLFEEIRSLGAAEALAQSARTSACIELIPELVAGLPKCLASIDRLRGALEAWQAAERRSRRLRFEQIAQAWGWHIAGSWPEPVVDRVAFVTIDEHKDRAAINGRPFTGKPTAERLAVSVAEEITTLRQNLTPPDEFIAQVRKAYVKCCSNPGAGVQAVDLLAEMTWQRQTKGFQKDPRADLFRGYPLAQFRADLTHYLASKAVPITEGGKSFELQVVGGSFAQEGIFMYFPQTDRLATCGRLIFQPSAKGPNT